MAQSPSHRFGQIIGDLIEAALRIPLEAIATKHGLYLDYKHARPIRRPPAVGNAQTKKAPNDLVLVKWYDAQGNAHLLDYVFEAGGTEQVQGSPKAFIEIAWRRYTKHSKNKAQEIQGAVLPLFEAFQRHHPFLGAVLAGEFTQESLTQLRSNKFHVLYFPYASVIAAFRIVDVDAAFGEDTPDGQLQAKVDAYEALTPAQRQQIVAGLLHIQRAELLAFLTALEVIITRTVQEIFIVALHGQRSQVGTIDDAIRFLENYKEEPAQLAFIRYEVMVRYTNGNEIGGKFNDKASAIDYLRNVL